MSAKNPFDKKTLILILFAILIFSVRLTNINETLYDDESNFAYSVTVMDEFGYNQNYYSPQPLNLIYKPFIALFGLETWVFRLIPWLFGILNVVLLYFFAKRNWGEDVAFWATVLMLVSFYPTLASLQFDVEGNLILFSIMLMFFSFLEYQKSSIRKRELGWQILAGVGLGVAVISKYNAVYIVVVLALYSLINNRWNFKESFNDLFMIYLVGFVLFLCYVLLGMIQSPQHWLDFIWVFGFGRYHSSSFGLMGIGMYLLWSTPLLFGFYILSIFKWSKENLLPFLWITISILFYTFVLATAGSMDRYFMNTIPALVILGGYFISKIKFKKIGLYFSLLITLVFSFFFFLINSLPIKYVPRFPSIYLTELKSLNFNFLFSYTSASGPTFGVNFLTIFLVFLVGFSSLFLYLIFSKRKLGKVFFCIFVLVSLSFNIFLVSEYLFHPTGVDVSDVKWKMMDFVRENNLDGPIYTNDQGIQWYFENDYWHKNKETYVFADNELDSNLDEVIKRIKTKGGTIILVQWPPLHEKSPAWDLLPLCIKEKTFYSNKVILGNVYICS